MPLPTGDQYYIAVQNPQSAFSDAELKSCKVETGMFDLPMPYAGGFTTTYHFFNNQRHWAVRCFVKDIPDLRRRYEAIGRFIQRNLSTAFFVQAECFSNGIRVGTQWHPIIKMQWVKGEPLNLYIENNISQSSSISRLVPEFVELVQSLESLGIAHGDLQHGNIIVQSGNLYLIDYDGLYLPELDGIQTNEIGHVNYQHPSRGASDYGANIDRFSAIVIYTALKALTVAPHLWNKYNTGENILFKQDDFRNPEQSALLVDLGALPELAQRFKKVCQLKTDTIPSLDQFVTGSFRSPEVPITVTTARRSQYEVIDARHTRTLLGRTGQRVEVIGRITDYHSGNTNYHGDPYVFLNFGNWREGCFRLVIWSRALTLFRQNRIDPENYKSKWVTVTGVIREYKRIPQIHITMPSEIQIITEDEAQEKLLGDQAPAIDVKRSKPTGVVPKHPEDIEKILNGIYEDEKYSSVPHEREDSTLLPPSQQHKTAASHGTQSPAPAKQPASGQYKVPTTHTPQSPSPSTQRSRPETMPRGVIAGLVVLGLIFLLAILPSLFSTDSSKSKPSSFSSTPNADYSVNDRPSAEKLYGLGVSAYERGALDQAIKYLKQAVDRNNKFYNAYITLGDVYMRKGRHIEALTSYEKARSIDGESIGAYIGIGLVHYETERYEESKKAFKEAVKLNPDFAEAHYALALVYQKSEQLDLAVRAATQAIRLKPNFAQAHLALGYLYLVQHRFDKAYEEHESLKAIDSKLAEQLFKSISRQKDMKQP